MATEEEEAACVPVPVAWKKFNPRAVIPYGCSVEHVYRAMQEFVDFLGFINRQLLTKDLQRMEVMMMPAAFSGMVGEFISAAIPKYCSGLVRNQYHNGHPDLIPAGSCPGDASLRHEEGIEIKGSRYSRGWQGHNPEDVWLMVFVFDSNRPKDLTNGVPPRPFQFKQALLGRLDKADWAYSGRSATSRRTITAGVTNTGLEKMRRNWIYRE
jgi:hypothetical protein